MPTVAVIGAGIIGAWTALECLDAGFDVVLIDPGAPGGRQAASYGNGGWVLEASLLPVATPGLWKKLPGMLADRRGALTVRWRHLPRLAPWLFAFVASGATEERIARIAAARHVLIAGAADRYRALVGPAGVGDILLDVGHTYVYRDEADYRGDALSWRMRAEYGYPHETLTGAALSAHEPGLGPDYRFGAHIPGGLYTGEPGTVVARFCDLAEARGARRVEATATGFVFEGDRLAAVKTDAGDVAADRAVVASGIASKALARAAGDRVPLESERGYHVVVRDPEYMPRHPVMPGDGKMALTPTAEGLRVAGQVELASVAAPPDWRRVDVLLDNLHRAYPAIPRRPDPDRLDRWMGHRPSTPDGLPIIDRSTRSGDVLYAFGHGHSGLSLAPGTARIVAGLLGDRPPNHDLAPYSLARFGPRRSR
ncbi:NAD(P)/FAD-dependent oxidoreductase [Acuticoccus kandeliae]|uniref:NAD(P)/FAD-dependent oxidoreductase n=1 Tax=Acuticoccus kandeliae TaxID=2073160 RepID=UPI000D3E9714|nr:FAD-binding oxidoreductase [Acuticoccus kandeliae]